MIDVDNSKLEYFEKFKRKYNAKNYEKDCNSFDLKDKIRDDLLEKQINQCAYCERFINKENSHIEHILPRDKNPKFQCEYSNLVLSCNNKDSCGEYKGNKIWLNNYIHPVLNNPIKYFKFNEDGRVIGINEDANATIEYLNLNSNRLIRIRKNIILEISYMDNIENLNLYFKEFENLIKEYYK